MFDSLGSRTPQTLLYVFQQLPGNSEEARGVLFISKKSRKINKPNDYSMLLTSAVVMALRKKKSCY